MVNIALICKIHYIRMKMGINMAISKISQFIEYWKERGYEKGECQSFWIELLSKVLGVQAVMGMVCIRIFPTFEKSFGIEWNYI